MIKVTFSFHHKLIWWDTKQDCYKHLGEIEDFLRENTFEIPGYPMIGWEVNLASFIEGRGLPEDAVIFLENEPPLKIAKITIEKDSLYIKLRDTLTKGDRLKAREKDESNAIHFN